MAVVVDTSKRILTANEAVRYGIFGLIRDSGYFPPREFLNEFLMAGYDPCDQDKRMSDWQPFSLSLSDYEEVMSWWISAHPCTVVSDLNVGSWSEWAQVIICPEDWGFPDGLPGRA